MTTGQNASECPSCGSSLLANGQCLNCGSSEDVELPAGYSYDDEGRLTYTEGPRTDADRQGNRTAAKTPKDERWVLGQLREGASVEQIIRDLRDNGFSSSRAGEMVTVAVERAVEEKHQERREAAMNDLLWGAIWGAGGGLITGITYAAAAPGGTYFVVWGAIAYGAFRFIRGLYRLKKALAVVGLAATGGIIAAIVGFTDVTGTSDAERAQAQYEDALGGSAPQRSTEFGNVSTLDLRAGDCFNDASGAEIETVTRVHCAGSWEFKVLQLVPLNQGSGASYPGLSYFENALANLCPFDATLGFYPTRESWSLGDRTLLCLQDR